MLVKLSSVLIKSAFFGPLTRVRKVSNPNAAPCVTGSVVDPDPHGSGTFAWIQQKVKEHINKTVNSGLFVLLDSTSGI